MWTPRCIPVQTGFILRQLAAAAAWCQAPSALPVHARRPLPNGSDGKQLMAAGAAFAL
jgi:hypothetical protein